MNREIIISLIIIGVLVLITLMFSGCVEKELPIQEKEKVNITFNIDQINVKNVTNRLLEMDILFILGNPNPFNVTVNLVDMDVYFRENGNFTYLGQIMEIPKQIDIPKQNITQVFQLIVDNETVINALLEQDKKGNVSFIYPRIFISEYPLNIPPANCTYSKSLSGGVISICA